ncbi:YgfZ/GcvT domain-containing protein [Natronoglycomyces albus]|uniref:Folate-binding protein YgfZ n=1 Tax=Natronoglycomyces albus TaxID=2811108 RepID=A0A895XSV1_9ACTN|nr:folate-binding protein [Natronoglycomyces albus]QSB05340.1 folate-binding protein YgfZ [Natronoglycomyces albus]
MNASVLLKRPGAVATIENGEHTGTTAWHYGDPLGEQRAADTGGAIFDLSDRDLITVTGGERLSWLHQITSQHLLQLPAHTGTELMVLSPTGRIEHHAGVYDDGTTTWLDCEPGAGEALLRFLHMMKFFTEVDIELRTDWAMLTVTQASLDLAQPHISEVPPAKYVAADVPSIPTSSYPGGPHPDGTPGWRRRTDRFGKATVDLLVPRQDLDATVDSLGLPLAGTWAHDALRVANQAPRVGIDTDHKTIPHEVPALLVRAVHIDKGCYRGQETVARVHNLGQAPRLLVSLHLDGTDEHPPQPDTEITSGERTVGRLGTAVQHYEEGQIALALLKRKIASAPETKLTVGSQAAQQ